MTTTNGKAGRVMRSSVAAEHVIRDLTQGERLRISRARARAYGVGMALAVSPPHLRPSRDRRFWLLAPRCRFATVGTGGPNTIGEIEDFLAGIERAVRRNPAHELPFILNTTQEGGHGERGRAA